MSLRNPFVLAPMTTYASNKDLTLSSEEEAYYEQRGKQFGLVVTAATSISKQAQGFHRQITVMNDSYLDSMTRLARAIKKGGAKAVLQLYHPGRMSLPNLFEGHEVVSASAVRANRDYTVTPRALTINEIYQVIDDFKQAAIRAMKSGFDGIELHGANTYLIQQFFSPHSNRRMDEFGGSLEKRMKFPLLLIETMIALRSEMNRDDFIIGYRLSPEEIEMPGITLTDTSHLISKLSQTDLDYIHFSMGSYKQSSKRNPADSTPVIDRLRQSNVGQKPLIGVGQITTTKDVAEAKRLGYDLFAIGMAALADEAIVDHLINHQPVKKVFDASSLLPKLMIERLKDWDHLKENGYEFK